MVINTETENKKFLLDEFCFFILFHVSNLNVDNNPFTLLQMILERLISELVFLYNSDDDNNILVHFDEQSSKARLRAILICKRLFLSNAQSLQTRWVISIWVTF